MAKIKAELEQQLRDNLYEAVDLIVRTAGDPTPHLSWLAMQRLQIRQQFKLTPGVAISGMGWSALKLLDQEWVVSVELDAPVKAM